MKGGSDGERKRFREGVMERGSDGGTDEERE